MKWFSEMPQTMNRREQAERGFTLFEMLVVLIIIALLATIVGPRVIGYVGTAKADVARAQLSSIATALDLYYIDMGRYPEEDEGLTALLEPPADNASWRGPYFQHGFDLNDPWGNPYIYVRTEPGDRFTLTTLGADGEVGGDGNESDLSRS